MDELKEAFSRVKEDMDFLYSEMNLIKEELKQNKQLILEFNENIKLLKENLDSRFNKIYISQKDSVLNQTDKQTDRQTDTPTDITTDNLLNKIDPTHIPTHPAHFKPLKPKNLAISIGNGGVPTDRQTDRQTHQQTDNSSHNQNKSSINSIENALQIISSLDNLKKEIRLKFKRLTDQEMEVFTTLYQLSEEYSYTDYRSLSSKLNLTESSIRDYVGRLIKKGIPVDKTKINNKSIQLSVSPNLKKVASLQTILQLRGI